jgi:hypothetical protein
MNKPWIQTLLLGLVLGAAGGYTLSERISASTVPQGSAFLRQLTLQELTAAAGNAEWKTLEDRAYSPFPALGRPGIGRRIVALSEMPDGNLEAFAGRLQQNVEALIERGGGTVKGEFDCSHSMSQPAEGRALRRLLDLPRRYYAIRENGRQIHGVADVWLVSGGGSAAMIVSLTE